jgi:hypothetical protein
MLKMKQRRRRRKRRQVLVLLTTGPEPSHQVVMVVRPLL